MRGSGREICRRPIYSDIEVFHFPQTWPDTSLGFGGIGGSAITTAYTTVINCPGNKSATVYFDGRLAYKVHSPEDRFFVDLKNRTMADVSHYADLYQPNMPF